MDYSEFINDALNDLHKSFPGMNFSYSGNVKFDPIPPEFDFLAYFLGTKIQMTLELWVRLGMKV